MEGHICIHGHFYQPPRENPWLEAIEYQDSAYPYHDWNQRITAECYQPNGVSRILDGDGRIEQIVNNYSKISFNFGPTLLSWIQAEEKETYEKIIEADRESRGRFSGHGSALAQAYNHSILPLCNSRDKRTQIYWGIKDFEARFGRFPESMWLPETAVDLESLDLMAQMGLKFVILAPHQARRARKRGDRHWHSVSNGIDPSMAYEIALPSGRRMAIFFYDGPISRAVAFEKLLRNGGEFANRLASAFSADRTWPQIVHIATDGETYGHHQPYGDMSLAYALQILESNNMVRLTNYGEFLERHPPTHLVDIWENTAWSCAHGIGRWKENCGCNSGMHSGWQQAWRAPLRTALDTLRDHLVPLFANEAAQLVMDPWTARDEYIQVLLNRSPESLDRFIARHTLHPPNPEERIRLLKLLELQRHAMLMYTSCGWFFDEISGIETVQVLQYAGRAIQLAKELFGPDGVESLFLAELEKAPSNVPQNVNGRVTFEKFVVPAMVDRNKVIGHYAVSSLFQNYTEKSEIYSYFVDRESYKVFRAGRARLAAGHCSVTSKVTSESTVLEFGVMHMGDHNVSGGVRPYCGKEQAQNMIKELSAAFAHADFPEVIRLMDSNFGKSVFSLRSLFRDEQRRVLNLILESTTTDIESLHRQAFEHTAPLMRFLMDLGLELPKIFRADATAVLNAQLGHAFEENVPDTEQVSILLDQADFWQIELDEAGLAFTLRCTIERLAVQAHDHPGDYTSLCELFAIVEMAKSLPFQVNFYRTQNIYYDILKNQYPGIRDRGMQGDQEAKTWTEQFLLLGDMLSIRVQ